MEIPISTAIEDPNKQGRFRYTKGFPADGSVRGVFAFTFYDRGGSDLKTNIYLRGIGLYLQCIRRASSSFEGWRVVVYMDSYTFGALQKEETLGHDVEPGFFLVSNPLVDCVIVEWPYYDPHDPSLGIVNGDILRCMRLRSFFDFFKIPVFLRDADSIFVSPGYYKVLDVPVDHIYEWESNYLRGMSAYPNTFVFGTSLGYRRFWHENEFGKQKAPLGAFAGLQSSMPIVPCFADQSLWNEAIDYILARSVRKEEVAEKDANVEKYTSNGDKIIERVKKNQRLISFSNEQTRVRHGKDEQIILYVLLPRCIDHVFFFDLDMFASRKFPRSHLHQKYPIYIFRRGSNTNLRDLFLNGIAKKLNKQLNQRIRIIQAKNNAKENQAKQLFAERLGNTKKINRNFLHNAAKVAKFSFMKNSSILPRALSQLYSALQRLGIKEKELDDLYEQWETLSSETHRKKLMLEKMVLSMNDEADIAPVEAEYKGLVDTYNKVVLAFLSKVLSLKSKEELVSEFSKDFTMRDDLPNIQRILGVFDVKKGGKRRKTRKITKRKLIGV